MCVYFIPICLDVGVTYMACAIYVHVGWFWHTSYYHGYYAAIRHYITLVYTCTHVSHSHPPTRKRARTQQVLRVCKLGVCVAIVAEIAVVEANVSVLPLDALGAGRGAVLAADVGVVVAVRAGRNRFGHHDLLLHSVQRRRKGVGGRASGPQPASSQVLVAPAGRRRADAHQELAAASLGARQDYRPLVQTD